MITIISSILVFLLVVMIHEFGHFFVAKMSGIQVNEFSIGMGPKIFQKNKEETKYTLRAFPIGGYVAMEGEEEYSNNPKSFNNASTLKKMAVVLAGAFMNFILGLLTFILIFLIVGYPSNEIGKVFDNSPAYESGFKKGDIIIKVSDISVNDLAEINSSIKENKNKETKFVIKRDNKKIELKVKPKYSKEANKYIIGISSEIKHSIFKSIKFGFIRTIEIIKIILKSLKTMITGSFKMEYLSGPVGVIQTIGAESSKGFIYFLQILGLISINLGVFNLLPIPALDGGKFLFILIEAIIKKPINEKIEQKLTLIGLSLLFSIMIYVTIFNDIGRLFK